MYKLNRSKPFGTVNPPEIMPGTDRPAVYAQDGKWFDAHDRDIVPGQKLRSEETTRTKVEAELRSVTGVLEVSALAETEQPLAPAELIADANTLPYAVFQREAKRILGDTCPGGKEQIVAALKKAVGEYTERQQKRGHKPRAKPDVADADPPDTDAESPSERSSASTKVAPAKPVKAGKGAIDLAAWARGDANYLMGDLRKAIRQEYGKQISGANEKMEALELLIDKKVVTSAQARKDIQNVGVG